MLLAGGSIQNQGFGLVPLTLIIQHPYANPSGGTYLSETLNFNTKPVVNWCQRPPVPGGCTTDSWQVETITILVALGDATESTIAHYSALSTRDVTHTAQQTLSPNNSSLTSAQQVYPCTTAAALGTGPHGDFGCYQILQGAFAAGWLTQASRAAHLAAAINSSALQLHHSVGIITSGPAIPGLLLFNVQSSVSINSASATASDRHAAFFTTAAVLDRLEGSIAEQQGSEWEGGSAISMLTRTNYVGNSPFYDLTSANISAALNSGQLSSWVNGGFAPTLTSYTSANFVLIVPQQATVGPFCFSNACAIFYFAGIAAFGPNNDRIAYATNGVGWDKGAAGVDDPTGFVTQQTMVQSSNAKRAANALAVSENTGAFTLSPTPDLVTGVGPFPYSLAYKRYYSSSQAGISGATDIIGFLAGFGVRTATELSMLPIGWTHSLAISARLTNDGMATLGRSSALDASQ